MSLHHFASLVENALRKQGRSRHRKSDRNRYLMEALDPIRFADQGLLAYFFFDQNSLADPLAIFASTDPIDYYWGMGSPGYGIAGSAFAARWEGQLTVPSSESGTFDLVLRTSGGVRLTLNGQTVIDSWSDQDLPTGAGDANQNGFLDGEDSDYWWPMYDTWQTHPWDLDESVAMPVLDMNRDAVVDGADADMFATMMDQWYIGREYRVTVQAGATYDFSLDFFNQDYAAAVSLSWEPTISGGGGAGTVVPTTAYSLPRPSAQPIGTVTGEEGAAVSFSTDFVDPRATGLAASVDWGDGTPADSNVSFAYATVHNGTLSASHAYADNGIYAGTLTLTGPTGTKSVPFSVTVANADPTGSITVPATAHAGDSVVLSFDDPQDAPGDADSLTYRFDLDGDGTYETDAGYDPSYQTVFSTTGIHTVGGRITDKDGAYVDSTATVTVDVAVSTPAIIVQTSATSTAATVQWPASPTGGTQYIVQLSTDAAFTTPTEYNVNNATSFSLPSLSPATVYYVRVAETNEGGRSAYSDLQPFVTPAGSFQTASRPTTSEVDLSWAPGASNVSFIVQRRSASSYFSTAAVGRNPYDPIEDYVDVAPLPPGATSYQDQGLPSGTDYQYRLLAVSADGYTSALASSPTLVESTVPAAPTASIETLTEDDSLTSLMVRWTTSGNGYRPIVEASYDGVTWSLTWGSSSSDFVSANFDRNMAWWQTFGTLYPKEYITGVEPGQTLYVRVRVASYRRVSEPSNVISVSAPRPDPNHPRPALPVVGWAGSSGVSQVGQNRTISPSTPVGENEGWTISWEISAGLQDVPTSVTVALSSPFGTAVPGIDYTSFPTSVTTTTASGYAPNVVVNVLDDTAPEQNAIAFVKIEPRPSYVIGGSPVLAFQIADDDWVDLDVDSNNTDGTQVPQRDMSGEDDIEDSDSLPGKIISANDGDTDGDGVPDYADGYGLSGSAATAAGTVGNNFTPMVLQLPQSTDFTKAKVRFTYDASNPAAVTPPSETNPGYALPDSGSLRLWTKDGSAARNSSSDLHGGGNYVANGVEYAATDLGLTALIPTATPFSHDIITLYAEAVEPSSAAGDLRVQVEVDPDGAGPKGWVLTDAVRLTAQKITVKWVETNTPSERSPLDANPHLNGGLRIFPDQDNPSDTVIHDTVDVEFSILPAPTVGQKVYFKAFDVDDPNAFAPGQAADEQIDPNDTASVSHGLDNRGTTPGQRGVFVISGTDMVSQSMDLFGRARVTFKVTHQPGDNFRIAAALNQSDFAGLTDDNVTPNNRAVPGFNGGTTDMLTVWRRLWIERDSMTGVTPNAVTVTITGVTANVPVPGVPGGLDVVQLSGTLPGKEDEFEGGVLTIAGFGVAGRDLPIYYNSDNYIYGDTVTVPGGSFSAAEIASITAGGVTATVKDDDDIPSSGTMKLPDGGPLMASAFGMGYVKPIYVDPGPGSLNVRGTVPFVRHLEDSQPAGARDLPSSSSNYWTTYLIGAFENYESSDADPDGKAPGRIPNPKTDEKFDYGYSNATTSYIFLETINDFVRQKSAWTDEAHTVTHEVGHTVGTGEGHTKTGIMKIGAPAVEVAFDNYYLNRFRSIDVW